MKKICRFLMVTLLSIFMCGLMAHAEGIFQGDGYALKYITEGNTASIAMCRTAQDREDVHVVIPAVIDGYKVVRIMQMSFVFAGDGVTSVTIQNGVTEIEQNAFQGCDNLKRVTIPNSVKKIGRRAFSHCERLEEITIPSGVTEIEQQTFYHCHNLSLVNIPNSVKKIGFQAFADCGRLYSIELPNSVTEIEREAFADCNHLADIVIPNGVTKIEDSTFYGCERLTRVTIPDTVTEIGDRAFCNCYYLASARIPNDIQRIGKDALGKFYEKEKKVTDLQMLFHEDNAVAEKYCKENKIKSFIYRHRWSEWKSVNKTTEKRTCSDCGKTETRIDGNKVTPTIKLSKTKVTLKRGKSYKLLISKLAAGDSVKSVKSSKTSVVSVKKVKKNQYAIKANKKKKGTAVVIVTLKSGLKKEVKVTVK